MTMVWKHVAQRLSLLAVALLLAACSSLGSTASSSTPTASSSPTPAVTMYTGDGFTLSYPKNWTKSVNAGQTIFQDSLGENALTVVVVANPHGVAKPSDVLKTTLAGAVKGSDLTAPSPANLPGSVSLAGETWLQGGERGTVTKGGASAAFEIVVLTTNHPANASTTKLFALIYAGQLEGSTLVDAQLFQAMLASFKFI